MTNGYCLVSQQIRDKIVKGEIVVSEDISRDRKGRFSDPELEARVQPSSFDPTIGNEAFVLDVENLSAFSPSTSQTVYRALLELPRRQRQRVSLEGGFEAKIGFTYIIPLREKISLSAEERIKSSPKSSVGRLFPITRMVTDYSPCFDEIHGRDLEGRTLQPWILFQPTAFNLIISPGLGLNQLRFMRGANASLSQRELLQEAENINFLRRRMPDGTLRKMHPVITDDGLQINLDLIGEHTSGIVALRARRNPTAIDMTKKGVYDAEDFFEPVKSSPKGIRFKTGEKYLIASQGVLFVPTHLSSELRRHYGVGFRADWDEAGFVDPNWLGDLVFEVTPTQPGGIVLNPSAEKPASALEFFRTSTKPDKVYGARIGSHYRGQLGVKVSKHFRPFDYQHAARNYAKLDREVLVQDANILLGFRQSREGFEPLRKDVAEKIDSEVRRGFWHSRYDCEDDRLVLQVIPYVILFGKGEKVFSYIRAENIKDYGDSRLFGKHSIGFGGHIITKDGPDYIKNCLQREVFREEVLISGRHTPPVLVGTLMAYDREVDAVHFGMIYKSHVKGIVKSNEKSTTSVGMRNFSDVSANLAPFETWSRKLIPFLPLIYRI